MSTQTGGSISDSTQRILEAAPALAKAGLTKSEAAREMGVPPKAVMGVVSRHLPDIRWRDGRPNARTTVGVKALAAEGLTHREIAQRLGVTRQRVSQIVLKCGIKRGLKPISVRKVERMKRMKAECAGMTIAQAATHLGVSRETIRRYKRETGFSALVREPNRKRGRFGERTQRIIKSAPALAARGLTKSEAARELGIPVPMFITTVLTRLPDVEWHVGHGKARNIAR